MKKADIDWFVLLFATFFASLLACLNAFRYFGYNANMYDIGNMAQAIWTGTQGQPLEFTYHGTFSRLGLHVEVFYFLLVPIYALFASPITLIIVQALFFGLAAFPLFSLARRRLESEWAARLVALIYLLYPVAQTAVLFDFHGDTIAMPLLIFMLDALDRHHWKSYWLWLILALSCKFYVAFPILLLGFLLLMQKNRKIGQATILLACTWGMLAFFVIRPIFAAQSTAVLESSPTGYMSFYYADSLAAISKTWIPRAIIGALVLLPVMWAAYRSPLWIALAAIMTIPVLLSNGDGPSYHYVYHHYALVVPFLLMALVNGLEITKKNGLSESDDSKWKEQLIATFVTILFLNIVLIDTPLAPKFWIQKPDHGMGEWRYGRTSRDLLKDTWLTDNIPSESPIASSAMLAPHLANRKVLFMLPHVIDDGQENSVDYVLADGLFDFVAGDSKGFSGGALYDVRAIKHFLDHPKFGLVSSIDGLLLFQKLPSVKPSLIQKIEVITGDYNGSLQATFAGMIGLVNTEVHLIDGARIRLTFTWLSLIEIPGNKPLFAVTTIDEINLGRILHLPSLALHPTTNWTPGTMIREQFDVSVPEAIQLNMIHLRTGWYDSSEIFSYATDERSQIGDTVQQSAYLKN